METMYLVEFRVEVGPGGVFSIIPDPEKNPEGLFQDSSGSPYRIQISESEELVLEGGMPIPEDKQLEELLGNDFTCVCLVESG